MRKIIGRFDKQRWVGDNAQSVGEVEFDATSVILRLTLREIQAVQDCEQSSDWIGQELVDHNGPCSVYLENAINEFFGVEKSSEITPAMLKQAREEFAARPLTKFRVPVSIVTTVELDVEARDAAAARVAATDLARSAEISAQPAYRAGEPVAL